MPRFAYDTDHEVGEHNVRLLGLDVHNPVFFASALLIIAFVLGTLLAPDSAERVMSGARGWTLEHAHWFFSAGILAVACACVGLALLPFGRRVRDIDTGRTYP